MDTHSDKRSLGCAILLTNTPRKRLANFLPELFLAKLRKGKNFPNEVNYYLESKRHNFDFIKSKLQSVGWAYKTLQSLSHFVEIMTAGGSPSHRSKTHFDLKSFTLQERTTIQVKQLKSIRIIAVCETHKIDSSLSTNTSNDIKKPHTTSNQIQNITLESKSYIPQQV